MTAYVSNQAGAWGQPLVWTPNGVPGAFDSVTINHAITDNATRAIGTGFGTAIAIGSGASLLHSGSGGAATFTISGNVTSIGGTWGTASYPTPFAAGSSLSIQFTSNTTITTLLGAVMAFAGNPAWNEASDLDRTTLASGVSGGATSLVFVDDLGLRAGGGDVLLLANDANGWLNGDRVTTSAYNPGTKTATVSATTNAHAAGARVMNMSRSIEFRSNSTTRRGAFVFGDTNTLAAQWGFHHVAFRYMGNSSTQLAPIYTNGGRPWIEFEDCAFESNRYAHYLNNPRTTGRNDITHTRTNFGYNDSECLRFNRWHSAHFDDCQWMLERVLREDGLTHQGARLTFDDCIFDSLDSISWPLNAQEMTYTYRDCDFARISTTTRAFTTNSLATSYGLWNALFDNCKMDSSMDTIVLASRLHEDGGLNVLHRNQVEGENEIWKTNGVIYRDTTEVVGGGRGASLKFDGTSATRPLTYTFYLPTGDDSVKVQLWARKDSSYGSSNRPQMTIRGLGLTEQTVVMTDVDDTWEELLTTEVTPSRDGFIEVELQTMAAAGLAWFDAPTVIKQ